PADTRQNLRHRLPVVDAAIVQPLNEHAYGGRCGDGVRCGADADDVLDVEYADLHALVGVHQGRVALKVDDGSILALHIRGKGVGLQGIGHQGRGEVDIG